MTSATSAPPVLRSPTHAVVGASDVEAACRFYAAFGFAAVAERDLPARAAAAAYGLAGATREVELRAQGAPAGHLLVVEAPGAAPPAQPYETGAHALDVYTRDTAAAAADAGAAGGRAEEPATLELGPLVMHHAATRAPDDVQLVLLDVNRRRPSRLDQEPERSYSELHSLLWAVDDIDQALPFWQDEAQLVLGGDVPLSGAGVARMLGLPDDDVRLRMVLLSDAELTPTRFELLEYVGRRGPQRASWPLTPGLHAPAFAVGDLEAAVRALPSAEFGDVAQAEGGTWTRAVSGLAPGGARFLLWQR